MFRLFAIFLVVAVYVAIDRAGISENPYLTVVFTFLAIFGVALFWACLRGFGNLASDIWQLCARRKNRRDGGGRHTALVDSGEKLIRQIGPPRP
jgi:hypothetical protein